VASKEEQTVKPPVDSAAQDTVLFAAVQSWTRHGSGKPVGSIDPPLRQVVFPGISFRLAAV
jgi:hypothetical protein